MMSSKVYDVIVVGAGPSGIGVASISKNSKWRL